MDGGVPDDMITCHAIVSDDLAGFQNAIFGIATNTHDDENIPTRRIQIPCVAVVSYYFLPRLDSPLVINWLSRNANVTRCVESGLVLGVKWDSSGPGLH